MKKKYFVHPSSYVEKGALVGKGTKIWFFSHISKGAVIGNDCLLGQNVFVGDNAIIGNGVKIQNNVSIYDKVTIEDHVFCGPSCVFTNVLNPRSEYPRDRGSGYSRTYVRRGATIGANATIVCGLTIGTYAFIGAGAVVTKDIPAYSLVCGNPARPLGWICECGERLLFKRNHALCNKCNKRYMMRGSEVARVQKAGKY